MDDSFGNWMIWMTHPKAPDGHEITNIEVETSAAAERYSWEEYAEHSLTHDPEVDQ